MVGTPVAKPTPIFTKLDPSVVDEELARPRRRLTSGPRAGPGRPQAARSQLLRASNGLDPAGQACASRDAARRAERV